MKSHFIWRFNPICNRDKYLLWNLILSEDLIPHAIEQNHKYTLSMVKGEQWRPNFTRARKTDRASFYLRAGRNLRYYPMQCSMISQKNCFWFMSVFFGIPESLRTTLMHHSMWDKDMETPKRKMVVQCIQLISNVQTTVQLHSFHKLAR